MTVLSIHLFIHLFIIYLFPFNALFSHEIYIRCILDMCADNQSSTKPNLVAKILTTNFGVFFVIYVMFSKICSVWV